MSIRLQGWKEHQSRTTNGTYLTCAIPVSQGKQDASNEDHHCVGNRVSHFIQDLHKDNAHPDAEEHEKNDLKWFWLAFSFSCAQLKQAPEEQHSERKALQRHCNNEAAMISVT
jgi:hypothetical protein